MGQIYHSADVDKVVRSGFQSDLEDLMRYKPDLSLALLELLWERNTAAPQIDDVTDFDAMQREIAYALYVRFVGQTAGGFAESRFLDALIRALIDPTSPWQLKLTYGRRGRPKSAFNDIARREREWAALNQLEALISGGLKVEAAIAEVAEQHKISRSKAFEIWQRRGEPDRKRFVNAQLAEYLHRPASGFFRDWWQRLFANWIPRPKMTD